MEQPKSNEATDKFERWQVIEWMATVPLGYVTVRDLRVTAVLVTRMQRDFARLPNDWKPSEDYQQGERRAVSAAPNLNKTMKEPTTQENNSQRPPALVEAPGYAAFIDRGNGWEQCTCEMSRDTARIYVRGRRKQEKAYPMGKRFKSDKVKRQNSRMKN